MTVSSKSILGNYLKVFKKPSHQYFARFEGSEGERKSLCIRIHQEHAE